MLDATCSVTTWTDANLAGSNGNVTRSNAPLLPLLLLLLLLLLLFFGAVRVSVCKGSLPSSASEKSMLASFLKI
jgi:hypothetical protein